MRLISKVGIVLFLLIGSFEGFAQDLPKDAVPGKCYMKCRKDAVWKTETERLLSKDASKVLTIVPAKFETKTERVLIKDEYKKLVVIPATFKTVTESVLVKEAYKKKTVVPAKYETKTERVLVEEANTEWKKQKDAMCKSSNTEECMVWCLVENPAQYKTITKRVLVSAATSTEIDVPAQYKTVSKTVVDKAAYTKEVTVPAQYKTVTKSVQVAPATVQETEVPAQYATVTKRTLVSNAGMGGYEEVDCGSVNKVVATGDKIADYSIADIQKALIIKGYNVGTAGANNEFNESTRQALIKFQRAKGIATGNFNSATLRALGIY